MMGPMIFFFFSFSFFYLNCHGMHTLAGEEGPFDSAFFFIGVLGQTGHGTPGDTT
jgi:hypothetical protein